jgi:glycosyltransferase involved in cell wall biosynthesis
MRIGIYRSASSIWYGGIFHYESVFVDALAQVAKNFPEELAVVASGPGDVARLAAEGGMSYRGLPVRPIYPAIPATQEAPDAYIAQRPTSPPPLDPTKINFNAAAEDAFRKAGIDLLLLLSPFFHAFACRMPFVMPIFDLNHKLQPEFPEVSDFGETNSRDYLYINTCRFATFVLVDSEIGKADVLRFYGDVIDENRIRILPYFPPIMHNATPTSEDLARVKAKYRLPDRFFFYPAQFWRHKNHQLILRAIRLIADQTGDVVPVVFCGSYANYVRALNFKELAALAQELGVADRVSYLGVVPDEDMAALHTLSLALVMPTFFGPTNIPPLEAWHYGRPVIVSNILGMQEQTGDAGLLVDPRSAPDLAAAMLKFWRDDALRAQLAERGRQRLATYSWDRFIEKISVILLEACERVRTERTPDYPPI